MRESGRRRWSRRLGWLLCLGALAAVPHSFAAAEDEKGKDSLQEVLQALVLPDLDGNNVSLGSYLGEGPLVLDFWATWCKPCLLAMPELQALYTELAPRGLRVVGINEDGPRNAAKVRPFLQTNGYTFPVLLDLNREVQRRLQAIALPTTLVFDQNGVLLHSSFGYRPGETAKLRTLLEPHLAPRGE